MPKSPFTQIVVDRTAAKIRKEIPAALAKKLPRDIAVVMVSEKVSQSLNKEYRKKDHSTNVLSFRYDDSYGELLICFPVVRREAKEQGNTQLFQMTWMIVHGMLHLAGLHHEKSGKTAKMSERIEQRVLFAMMSKEAKK
ncbi:MAG: rRNA maturation RNase YbeY [bacterium]|nr:rRNA maturation RNase YbeY [bacterium]